jgi:acyl-CoA synthetase (NDP forming)
MHRFFDPSSVVVIGVSDSPSNMGRNIFRNLMKFAFKGDLYAVGAKAGTVFGHPIYGSVLNIQAEIHLAVIMVKAEQVPAIAEDCGKKGIKRLVISSSGFAEKGRDGLGAENLLRKVCSQYGIRVIGPNCMGIVNMENGLFLPFSDESPDLWKKGPVGIISQSGTVALDYARHISNEKLGVSRVASIGNKFDMDEVDFLEYYLADDETKIIFLHLESFSRGRAFYELACTSQKPILIHKSNTSPLSQTIARSHTNALANDDRVADFAINQAGMIRVGSLEEFLDTAKVLHLPPLKEDRLAVLSVGGGIGVMAADQCKKNGFGLPRLPRDFLDWLKSQGRAGVISPTNPIDTGDIHNFDCYPLIFDRLMEFENIDGVFYDVGHTPISPYIKQYMQIAQYLNQANKRFSKPLYVRMPVYDHPGISELIESLDFPFFRSLPGAFQAMGRVRDAQKAKQCLNGCSIPDLPLSTQKDPIIEKALSEEKTFLSDEGYVILEQAGIPCVAQRYVTRDDANGIDNLDISFPVALKATGKGLVHKTELGGVRLNLWNHAELSDAVSAMRKSDPLTEADGFLVQEMAAKGLEMIIGAKRDPHFGPLVLAGVGGVMVELLSDTVMALAPLDMTGAQRLLESLKGYPLLDGFRNAAKVDVESLCRIIVKISELMIRHTEISEIDLNPVIVYPEGDVSVVVDCKMFLKGPREEAKSRVQEKL